MRSIVVFILFGCLLGLIVGCGGDGVEIPKNPVPLPKNLKSETAKIVPAGENASGERVPPYSPAGAPRGKK